MNAQERATAIGCANWILVSLLLWLALRLGWLDALSAWVHR